MGLLRQVSGWSGACVVFVAAFKWEGAGQLLGLRLGSCFGPC